MFYYFNRPHALFYLIFGWGDSEGSGVAESKKRKLKRGGNIERGEERKRRGGVAESGKMKLERGEYRYRERGRDRWDRYSEAR